MRRLRLSPIRHAYRIRRVGVTLADPALGSSGMNTFRIGGDLEVRRLGFGAMHLSRDSIAVVRRAVELGVTLIDTAYLYGGGANEELLVEALHPYPDGLLVTTKVGVAQTGAAGRWKLDGRPEVLREQVERALGRLRMERLELLQLHRIDPDVPLADQVGTLRDLQAEGKIGRIGLSEVTVEELSQARALCDVVSVQNRYNLLDREHEEVLTTCTEAGIAFLPWRPVAAGAFGAHTGIAAVAAGLGATPTQVGLAWLLARSPVMLPIPGTADVGHLEENLAADGLDLSEEQRAALDAAV
jgi:aryl-alcohol dehydrogenase-like predicted oxidoreductase